MFKYLFKKRTPIKLGRWEHRLNDNQINLKNILSNHDHCGDKICQYPLNIHKESQSNKKNTRKYRVYKEESTSCCILLGFHTFCKDCNLLNNKL